MLPASRSASVSPTHMIGFRPCASAACTAGSPSRPSRRTAALRVPDDHVVAQILELLGPTSPVDATASSQCAFWAPTLIDDTESATSPSRGRRTAGRRSSRPPRPRHAFADARRQLESRIEPHIHFQLPAMIGVLLTVHYPLFTTCHAPYFLSGPRAPSPATTRPSPETSPASPSQCRLVEHPQSSARAVRRAEHERHRVPRVRRHHRRRRVVPGDHQHVGLELKQRLIAVSNSSSSRPCGRSRRPRRRCRCSCSGRRRSRSAPSAPAASRCCHRYPGPRAAPSMPTSFASPRYIG